jgi:phage terminase large subunit-like protein
MNTADLQAITPERLRRLSEDELRALVVDVSVAQQIDRKENQLYYYRPASDGVIPIHQSRGRITGIGGGNGSSKTSSALVELAIHATGVVPFALRGVTDWSKKLRGPVRIRVVCENLTTVLGPILLPMLKWNHWTGVDAPGGDRGHWGWIPRDCLIDGDWDRSWTEKSRMLRTLYRHPENPDEVVGESIWVFNSYDQDPKDFASGDYHFVLLDEPPPLPIFRENQARTMRVNGRILMAMTWPDDPTINVDWIFDEVYEPGRPGPKRDETIDWIEISSLENRNLMTEAVTAQAERWDKRTRDVRIHGRPIRFTNRVHPLFSEEQEFYCFACGDRVLVTTAGRCRQCDGTDVEAFQHVEEFDHSPSWPVIWVVDPHPRKPHMSIYVAVTPSNELWQVAELQAAVDPSALRVQCDELEQELQLDVRLRLMDPRMGGQPAGANRERNWLQEFAHAGLPCDPADPSDVGRGLLDEYLRPDFDTRRPRARVHARCPNTIQQMKRFMWDDWRHNLDKSQKQRPKDKWDDYPACWRYVMNAKPDHEGLTYGHRVLRGSRRAAPTGSKRRRRGRRR